MRSHLNYCMADKIKGFRYKEAMDTHTKLKKRLLFLQVNIITNSILLAIQDQTTEGLLKTIIKDTLQSLHRSNL